MSCVPVPVSARDWDWSYLACEPRAINLWLWPYYESKIWCPESAFTSANGCPARPRGLNGWWESASNCTDAAKRECGSVALFNKQTQYRLGSLDAVEMFSHFLLNRVDDFAWGAPKPNCSMLGNGSESNKWVPGVSERLLALAANGSIRTPNMPKVKAQARATAGRLR